MAPITRPIGRTRLRVPEIGFGAAPLGNLYRPVAEAQASATLAAALDAGLTHIDTAPYYGFGLSERRVGDAVRGRQDIVLSTKVGRLLAPDGSVQDDAERHGFRSALPFRPVYDYSHDGILRSWEASLQRLGLARIDILYVHDIGRQTHGDAHEAMLGQLTQGGGFRALERLRAEGAISAFGIGVNELQACLDCLSLADLDVILLAGRYTLLEQGALDRLMPVCAERGITLTLGGVFNSGILATGTRGPFIGHYNYAPAAAEIVERVRRIEDICARHTVPLPAAALQFALAHPQVSSVIPGLDCPERVQAIAALRQTPIPPDLWVELRASGLLRADAPVPTGASCP
ncbi:aldo/keto reductase [Niveispirillum sp. SYP-B3756]|uniref:aldo/keto reductase n=1 Tax=Niveispirillum sp. SYP-B3756 TaxID=2662178 RepID=UPI001290CAAC|nr:aldo/keto reductase [Niveispirillum sp. SYP-B3756]MQP68076.1 aldo/keto reductase [Niveispirillum sp. SYP-B3756]